MATLIDASVLIASERQQLDLDPLLAEHAEEEAALAAMTASEFLLARAEQGVGRKRAPLCTACVGPDRPPPY